MNPPSSCLPSVSRRDALKAFGASAFALAASFLPARAAAASAPTGRTDAPAEPKAPPAPTGPFKLPPLGYAYDALEPAIDAETMEIHYTKHHQAYIDNANRALQGHADLAAMSPEEILRNYNRIPSPIRRAVRDNVGGHANHTLFWDILTPGGPKMPGGRLARQIERDLGSYDELIRGLDEMAMGRFGSGWAWLVVYNNKLLLESLPNQDSPLIDGAVPVLGIDVWEHAYYLKYRNRRNDYVKAVFGLINWERVGRRFEAAMGKA